MEETAPSSHKHARASGTHAIVLYAPRDILMSGVIPFQQRTRYKATAVKLVAVSVAVETQKNSQRLTRVVVVCGNPDVEGRSRVALIVMHVFTA